jgi:hypothetical protein
MNWTKQELTYLKNNYEKLTREEIAENLQNRKWTAISKKAYLMGLKRSQCNSNVYKLLEENWETYYWIGFIFADGHITKKNELSVKLSVKDIEHLFKLSNYIKVKMHKKVSNDPRYCGLRIMDNIIVKKIKNKFCIHNDKTRNPIPKQIFEKMNDDLFCSMIIGFIDGDGNIKKQTGREDCVIQMAFHKSWTQNFEYFKERLSLICNIPKINSQIKFAKQNSNRFAITNNTIIDFLKKKTLELNLPSLHRKWNNINLNRVIFSKLIEEKRNKIIKLIKKGLTRLQIADKMSLSLKQLDDFTSHQKITHKQLGVKTNIKKIIQYNNNGFYKEWNDGIAEASRQLNISHAGINQALSGKSKTCNGYFWKYNN